MYQTLKKNCMKSLKKIFLYNKYSIQIRNYLNLKPVLIYTDNIDFNCSISDAFCWRTDNNFETIFKFSDILKIFGNIEDSLIEFYFYSNKGNFLKKFSINDINYSNELKIDKNFFNEPIENYGIFYIHHFTKKNQLKENTIFSNRCYLGYSQNKNLHSFVHGNTLAQVRSIDSKNKISNSNIITRSNFMIYEYNIQKNFTGIEKLELFFANPVDKKIKFKILNKIYLLNKNESKIVQIENKSKIKIISNCSFLRPTAFNYKKQYLDVHHC